MSIQCYSNHWFNEIFYILSRSLTSPAFYIDLCLVKSILSATLLQYIRLTDSYANNTRSVDIHYTYMYAYN